MFESADLLLNALVAGMLLGGFYACLIAGISVGVWRAAWSLRGAFYAPGTAGISVSFGILDIVNIAHPGFIIVGSYIAYIVNAHFGLDPILVGILGLPAFYALGALTYQVYYVSFERRGQEALRGLAFFFGLLFITEVVLILVFGVDYRYATPPYIARPPLSVALSP